VTGNRPIKYPLHVSPVRSRDSLAIVDANDEVVFTMAYRPQFDGLDRRDADRLCRFANTGALVHHLAEDK
jgi:hypothetical protein